MSCSRLSTIPVARRRAQEFLQQAGVRLPSAAETEFAELDAIVRSLIGKELLIDEERRIQCNPDIVEAVTRTAVRKERLHRWVDAVNKVMPERDIGRQDSFPLRSEQDLVERIRMAIHLNDAKAFKTLMTSWYHLPRSRQDEFDLYRDLFNRQFDEEWLYSRVPYIRDGVMPQLIRNAHLTLMPSSGPVALLHRIASESGGLGSDLELALEHELLVGNLENAERLLRGDDTSLGELYRGWLCFLRGDSNPALSHFESSVRRARKQTGKREVLLPSLVDIFYVLTLVASGDHARIGQALRYIKYASRKRREHETLHLALRSAAHLAEGKVHHTQGLGGTLGNFDGEPPLFQLFVYGVLCWADEGAIRKARAKIRALERFSEAKGYPWAAFEFGQILNRACAKQVRHSVLSEEDAPDGFVSLLSTAFDVAPWEQSLLALERLSKSVSRGGEFLGESRMTWRVQVVDRTLRVEPFEQKMGKSGRWSNGKAVSLKLIHSGARRDSLTAQDAKVCAAIKREQPGKYEPVRYRMQADKAAEALVGHPLVFRADAPEASVEIVRDDPQLRVTTEGSLIRIRLCPKPPDSGTIIASALSSTRVVVCSFRKKHREIIDLLGSEGLLVPSASKQAVERAVSAASRLLTVPSDIGGGDAADAETVADPTPQIHLTPYGEGMRAEPLVKPFSSEGPAFRPGKGGRVVFSIVGRKRLRAQRNLEEETRRFAAVRSSCRTLDKASWDGTAWILEDPYDTLELLEQLHMLGDEVIAAWPNGEPMRIRQRLSADRLAVRIRKSKDWFEIAGSAELDAGLLITLQELLDHVREARTRFLPLGERGVRRSHGEIPEED